MKPDPTPYAAIESANSPSFSANGHQQNDAVCPVWRPDCRLPTWPDDKARVYQAVARFLHEHL